MSGDVVVLGAGLAGLSAAAHLGSECEVFEQHDRVGPQPRVPGDQPIAAMARPKTTVPGMML